MSKRARKNQSRWVALLILICGLGGMSSAHCASVIPAKPPVIFAHGFGVPSLAYEVVLPLKALFQSKGYEFYVAAIPANGSIEERARILNAEIARLVPSGPLHLIGHSMGGLDSRLAIYRYGLGGRVLSISTLATPHHGSPLADELVALEQKPLSRMLLKRFFAGNLRGASDLTTRNMEEIFNAEVKDDPRVRYFSWGFYIPEPVFAHSIVPWLWVAHSIVSRAGAPSNDGMVSVESSAWGEFMGALPGDHYSETGPVPLIGGPSYLKIFGLVLENLRNHFEKRSN